MWFSGKSESTSLLEITLLLPFQRQPKPLLGGFHIFSFKDRPMSSLQPCLGDPPPRGNRSSRSPRRWMGAKSGTAPRNEAMGHHHAGIHQVFYGGAKWNSSIHSRSVFLGDPILYGFERETKRNTEIHLFHFSFFGGVPPPKHETTQIGVVHLSWRFPAKAG